MQGGDRADDAPSAVSGISLEMIKLLASSPVQGGDGAAEDVASAASPARRRWDWL